MDNMKYISVFFISVTLIISPKIKLHSSDSDKEDKIFSHRIKRDSYASDKEDDEIFFHPIKRNTLDIDKEDDEKIFSHPIKRDSPDSDKEDEIFYYPIKKYVQNIDKENDEISSLHNEDSSDSDSDDEYLRRIMELERREYVHPYMYHDSDYERMRFLQNMNRYRRYGDDLYDFSEIENDVPERLFKHHFSHHDMAKELNNEKDDQKILDEIGLKIHNIYKKYQLNLKEIEEKYKSQNIISIKEIEKKIEECKKIYDDDIKDLATEFQTLFSNYEENPDEKRMRELQMEHPYIRLRHHRQSYATHPIDGDRNWKYYAEDIYKENKAKSEFQNRTDIEEIKDLFIDHLKEYAPHYKSEINLNEVHSMFKLYHEAFKLAEKCVGENNLNDNDLGYVYCGVMAFEVKESFWCHVFRSSFSYFTLDDMRSILNETKIELHKE